MKQKKRSFTLLEVLTTLFLFTIMLSSLVSYSYWITHIEENLEKKWNTLENLIFCQRSLESVFQSSKRARCPHPQFFTENKVLYFAYDRGVQSLPEFSGPVLAALYHDSKSQDLLLTLWPYQPPTTTTGWMPPPSNSFTFPLLSNVSECAFSFYAPPFGQKSISPKEIGSLHPQEGWQSDWRRSYLKPPSIMKISIKTEKKDSYNLLFDLGESVHYPTMNEED